MASMHDWLQRLKDYGERVANSYMSSSQQTSGLPGELAAKQGMIDQVAPSAPAQPPMQAQPTLAPYEHVSPGYAPIGGTNALQQLYSGRAPKLR
jgi:hypothetical protein